jgi:hypothetical protein
MNAFRRNLTAVNSSLSLIQHPSCHWTDSSVARRLDGHQRCAETTKASSSVLVCFALSRARFKDEMQHAKQHPSLKSRTDSVEIWPADGLN